MKGLPSVSSTGLTNRVEAEVSCSAHPNHDQRTIRRLPAAKSGPLVQSARNAAAPPSTAGRTRSMRRRAAVVNVQGVHRTPRSPRVSRRRLDRLGELCVRARRPVQIGTLVQSTGEAALDLLHPAARSTAPTAPPRLLLMASATAATVAREFKLPVERRTLRPVARPLGIVVAITRLEATRRGHAPQSRSGFRVNDDVSSSR